jgi:hypothetical protein
MRHRWELVNSWLYDTCYWTDIWSFVAVNGRVAVKSRFVTHIASTLTTHPHNYRCERWWTERGLQQKGKRGLWN